MKNMKAPKRIIKGSLWLQENGEEVVYVSRSTKQGYLVFYSLQGDYLLAVGKEAFTLAEAL